MIQADLKEQVLEYMYNLGDKLLLQRFSVAREKQTQLEVEQFLLHTGIAFEREKRLSSYFHP